MPSTQNKKPPMIIKKYANRRLYDTETSAYITLEDLCDHVKQGREFTVVDAKTGHDLTRQVLAQIIFEQETKGFNILPTDFLRSVIRFYDNGLQDVLGSYLETSMKSFTANQDRFKHMIGNMTGLSSFGQMGNPFEEMTKQNVALFEKTMSMFNPFGTMFGGEKDEKK
jgi:polyhydroxyalkanoate synthesis repressor PhaR